jgi:fermentation-respiration switch protein FrsA (DUF1100 family)
MGAAGAVIGILLGALVLIWSLQRRLMYFPIGDVPAPDVVGLAGATPVSFSTRDRVMLGGWFIAEARQPRRLTVLVFNGNAGNRAFRAPLAQALTRQGFAVFLFDYRGFGGNAGVPTELGLMADSRAAREYVLSRADVDPRRLAFFGESLGSAVAADLAAEFPPAALVLRSPFRSMVEVGRLHYPFLPVRWLLRDRFATIDRIAHIRSPLLVIAGDRDRIVPLTESRRLYDAAPEPKKLVVIPDADHNDDALLAGPQMMAEIARFLSGPL